MLQRPGATLRKVHFDEVQLASSYDSSSAKHARPLLGPRRRLRANSLLRLASSVLLAIVFLALLRQRFFPVTSPQRNLAGRDTVLGNCISLEALRSSDECYEFVDFKREYKKPQNAKSSQQQQPLHDDHRGLKSSFGAVLDYEAAYDAFTDASVREERYATRRTLKCPIGFGMSIVWDFEFETPLQLAYKTGTHAVGTNSGRVKDGQREHSCPGYDSESSASMSLAINCGVDIQRDPWGNPAAEQDHDALETCTRMAYSWVKEEIGISAVEPWANLCNQDSDGIHYRCKRHVFQLEGSRR